MLVYVLLQFLQVTFIPLPAMLTTIVGTLMFALSIMIGCIVFPNLPADNIFRSDSLWLGIGVIGVVGLWGIVIRENRKNAAKDK